MEVKVWITKSLQRTGLGWRAQIVLKLPADSEGDLIPILRGNVEVAGEALHARWGFSGHEYRERAVYKDFLSYEDAQDWIETQERKMLNLLRRVKQDNEKLVNHAYSKEEMYIL